MRRAVFIGLLSLLSACATKTYVPPEVLTPPAFKENADWKPGAPADAALRGPWWEAFGDEHLNRLESQISVSNQTLRQAQARFEEARASVRGARSALYPQVTAAPTAAWVKPSGNRAISSFHDNYADLLLPASVTYEADVWGRIRNSVEASRTAAQATAADLGAREPEPARGTGRGLFSPPRIRSRTRAPRLGGDGLRARAGADGEPLSRRARVPGRRRACRDAARDHARAGGRHRGCAFVRGARHLRSRRRPGGFVHAAAGHRHAHPARGPRRPSVRPAGTSSGHRVGRASRCLRERRGRRHLGGVLSNFRADGRRRVRELVAHELDQRPQQLLDDRPVADRHGLRRRPPARRVRAGQGGVPRRHPEPISSPCSLRCARSKTSCPRCGF